MDYKKCPNGHYYKGEVCPQCGFSTQPAAEQVTVTVNQNQNQNQDRSQNQSRSHTPVEKPSNFLAQSILLTILCCVPFGIPAIIFASQVDALWNKGDFDRALHARAQAKKWCLIGLITGLVGWSMYLILYGAYLIALISGELY